MINQLSRWMRWWEERAAPPLISEGRCTDDSAWTAKRHYLDRPPPVCFIVDEDAAERHFLSLVLQDEYVDTGAFADAAALRDGFARRTPDIVFLQVRPVARNAVDAIRILAEGNYHGPVQLMSAGGPVDLEAISQLGRQHGMQVLAALKRPLDRNAVLGVLQSQELDRSISQSERISLDLALRRDWIEFWYQPKINLFRKQLAGVELFARVRHPQHGILSPAAFLKGAQDKSLVELIEKSIIDALNTGAKCAKLGVNLRLAINVSPAALAKLPLADIIREHRPNAEHWPGLIFDLTEDQIASDFALSREVGAELEELGIALAIDDFGRGYLPLSRLRELPKFAELKIDRSFVTDCATDNHHAAICKSVIDLAHNFGSKAVGVGVEKPADANALTSMGCDLAQGYLFAQPMAVDRFHAMLRQRAEKMTQQPLVRVMPMEAGQRGR